jgi:hypothetical protein
MTRPSPPLPSPPPSPPPPKTRRCFCRQLHGRHANPRHSTGTCLPRGGCRKWSEWQRLRCNTQCAASWAPRPHVCGPEAFLLRGRVKRGAVSSMRYTRRPRDSDKSETGPGESGGDEREEKSGGGVSALAAIRVPAIVVGDGLQHAQLVAGVQVPRWIIHLEPFAPNNSAQTHQILPGSLTTEGERGGGLRQEATR